MTWHSKEMAFAIKYNIDVSHSAFIDYNRVIIPRNPRVIQEIFDTLRIIVGAVKSLSQDRRVHHLWFRFDKGHKISDAIADTYRASTTDEEKVKDKCPKIRLCQDAVKNLAMQILKRIYDRFGQICRTVKEDAAKWSSDNDQPHAPAIR